MVADRNPWNGNSPKAVNQMKWIELILSRLRIARHPNRRTRRALTQLSVTRLEDRTNPSTANWTGLGSNANWSTAANWNTDQAPSGGEDLVFPAGAAQLTSNNDLAGKTFHSITFGAAGYTLTGDALTVTNGITATYTAGTSQLDLNPTLVGTETVSVAAGGTLNVSGQIGGTGAGLTKTGAGTLLLSVAIGEAYTGTTTVSAGELDLDGGFYGLLSGPLVIDATGGSALVKNLANYQVEQQAVTLIGSGATWDLNGYNDDVGLLTFTGGTVESEGGQLSPSGSVVTNAASTTATISGVFDFYRENPIVFDIATGTVPNGGPDLDVSAVVKDGGFGYDLEKVGAGVLGLSGTNTYSGGTTVNAGTIRVESANALGSLTGGTTVANGASLALSGGVSVAQPITINGSGSGGRGAIFNESGDNTLTGPITLGSASALGALSGTLEISGLISDGGSGYALTKVQAGTVSLTGANSYTGGTTVSGGVLAITNAAALGTGPISVSSGGELDLSNDITFSQNVLLAGSGANGNGALQSVSGNNVYSGTATLQANATGIGVGAGQLTLSGSLTDDGNLYTADKYGPGLLLVTGTLALSGPLDTVAGNVQISGSYSSAVVLDGGTVSGTGTVGSISQVGGTGGTVDPGTGSGTDGTLTTLSGYSIATGATTRINIGGTTAGATYGQIVNASGSVTLTGSAIAPGFVNGFVPAIGDVFTIINNQGNGAVIGTFNGLPEGAALTVGGVTLRISYVGGDGNDVTLTTVAVSTTALTASAAAPTFGQSVTFTAVVATSGGTATGSVRFSDTGAPFVGGTVALVTVAGQQVATFTTDLLTAGSHTITATYLGAPLALASTGALVGSSLVVTRAGTTTSVTSSGTSDLGQSVTFTVVVTGAASVTGAVNFYNTTTGAYLGTAGLNGTGVAQLTTSAVTAGPSAIRAVYSGDGNDLSSSGDTSQLVRVSLYAAGSAAGGTGVVTVYNAAGTVLGQFQPFGAYSGGVKVAVGDVAGNGYDDLIVMAGPGALNGLVQIYSGRDFSLLSTYFAFPGYAGEFNIAVGDLTGNGVADVIFSTATGGDFVFAYAGASNSFIVPIFSAFGGFTGGVTLAAGDILGNGMDQIIVGTASRVGAAGVFNPFGQLLQPYYFAPIPMDGVNVAAADLNGDGHADLIFGAKTNSTLVLEFDGVSQGLMGYFFAYPGQSFGVTVATVDRNGDGKADIITGFTGDLNAFGIYNGETFQLIDIGLAPSGPHGLNVAGSGAA